MSDLFCKNCGERDQNEFYKNSGSLMCKACKRELANKKYRETDLSQKKPKCRTCGEEDPTQFRPNIRYECKLCYSLYHNPERAKILSSSKCLVCGTEDTRLFHIASPMLCEPCKRKRFEEKIANKHSCPLFTCRKCGQTGKENFYKSARYQRLCKACVNKHQSRYYYPFYDDLIKAQGGEFCAVCHQTPEQLDMWRLTVDHDHASGFVRGLLCQWCNRLIGLIEKNSWEKFFAYLSSPPAKHLRVMYPEKMKKAMEKRKK
jgi:hypothetical protein